VNDEARLAGRAPELSGLSDATASTGRPPPELATKPSAQWLSGHGDVETQAAPPGPRFPDDDPPGADLMASALDAALAYAERGMPVIPVDPATKVPLTAHGSRDARSEPRGVRELFRGHPDPGVAIVTGHELRTGGRLIVLDVDPRHGGLDGLADLTSRLGPLPPTLSVQTPQGGWHFYLRTPGGVFARNSAGALALGVDVRGTGGFAVAPPTRNDRGAWTWSTRMPPAALPATWLAALDTSRDGDRTPPVRTETWLGMIRGGLPEGERNQGLTRLVGHLLARGVEGRVVLELAHLVNARCRPPLTAREVDRVVDSIAGREIRKRRRPA
jgi:hypothetical protein